MSYPTVTVILPVYNGENYVRFAIESVLSQTVKDLELVVVDDGSTDSTPEIIASYGPPIRYVRRTILVLPAPLITDYDSPRGSTLAG